METPGGGPHFNLYDSMLYREQWRECRQILEQAGAAGVQDLIDARVAAERLRDAARLDDVKR